MDMRDFHEIRKYIRAVWETAIETEESIEVWYQTFKRYEYDQIKAAVNQYMQTGRFEPKPADILSMIPTGRSRNAFDPAPKYETINGRKTRVYICQRCKDTGMYTWEDDQQRVYGKPCDCPAGHYYYRWGWLSEDEQKEAVARTGRGADRIGECWYEKQR